MKVKYWNFAGLCLTDWCNASCACCYMGCSPAAHHDMNADTAVAIWQQLQDASPHGCRIHLSGGEVFGDWPKLIDVARRAHQCGLGPLEKVETNAYWFADEAQARQRIEALSEAGMETFAISADPFHQQFVPIDKPRRLAALAREILGPGRVQVRWEDWLADGEDLTAAGDARRREIFTEWRGRKRERINGRAAEILADLLPRMPMEALVGRSCREPLLRSKHIHVNPDGSLTPGVCAGILVGQWTPEPDGTIAANRQHLVDECDTRPIVSRLAAGGPVALAELAREQGFAPNPRGYVSKCHLCWSVRKFLATHVGRFSELGPAWLYGI